MRAEDVNFLLSAAGRAALAELGEQQLTPDTHLATVERLRARWGGEAAAALLEMAQLRQRARAKFARAAEMFFTRDGLEQATAETVADHRARRFAAANMAVIADLGCGIGGDALALARAGASLIAIDRDWAHVRLAQANAAVHGTADRLLPVVADLLELSPLPADGFFFDPARRTPTGPRLAPGRRLWSVDDYRPPLSLIDAWRPLVPSGAVKVGPGIDYNELPAAAEAEFVSLRGEVKEAVLWFGRLRTEAARRATLLPDGATLTELDAEVTQTGPPRAYLYEPDGAVIRAHLVGQVAAQLGATLLDPHIAFLSADGPQTTPFARGYRLQDAFPFQLKRLRSYLRQRDVGVVTIKKRGSPLDPDVLRQALRLRGEAHRTIFLTQVMGRATVLISD